MTLRISGKSVNVGEALRGRVTDRTEEVLRKYFDGNYSGHITLSKDGFGFRTDCALHLDSGITLEADSNAPDAYASADQALVMIEKRLKRYKSRLKDRSARKAHVASAALAAMDATSYVLEAPGEGEDEDEVTGYSPVIIAEATTSLKPLSVSEAVMELDLSGAPCLVFQHGSSGRVNIIYRRADGNVGWIDPPGAKAEAKADGKAWTPAAPGTRAGSPFRLNNDRGKAARGSWHRDCVGVEAPHIRGELSPLPASPS